MRGLQNKVGSNCGGFTSSGIGILTASYWSTKCNVIPDDSVHGKRTWAFLTQIEGEQKEKTVGWKFQKDSPNRFISRTQKRNHLVWGETVVYKKRLQLRRQSQTPVSDSPGASANFQSQQKQQDAHELLVPQAISVTLWEFLQVVVQNINSNKTCSESINRNGS